MFKFCPIKFLAFHFHLFHLFQARSQNLIQSFRRILLIMASQLINRRIS